MGNDLGLSSLLRGHANDLAGHVLPFLHRSGRHGRGSGVPVYILNVIDVSYVCNVCDIRYVAHVYAAQVVVIVMVPGVIRLARA